MPFFFLFTFLFLDFLIRVLESTINPVKRPENLACWHGNISRQDAEKKVSIQIPANKSGVYLARTSSQSASSDQGFALTIFYKNVNQIGHLLVSQAVLHSIFGISSFYF